LVRYHIADAGGLVDYRAMLDYVGQYGVDPVAEVRQLTERGVRPLPFAYVFGRADFTISYFGANVYPENVTVGLEQSPIDQWVTGKFVMQAREDDDRNRYLSIVVELAPNVATRAEIAPTIAQSIVSNLLRLNSEFAHSVPADRQHPVVELKPHGDPDYFP